MGGHVACLKKIEGGRILKKSDHLQDVDVDGRAILNLSSRNNLWGCGVWSGLIWLRTGTRGLFL